MNGTITLESRDLSVGYVDHKLLSDINLKSLKGELICLMGSNGTGKSTLLRTLSGLKTPLGGRVLINGRDLHTISAKEKATFISIVLTDRVDLGYTCVEDLVAMGRYPHTNWWGRRKSVDDTIVQRSMNATGLEELAKLPVRELSDGQKQKVMIGRALAQDGEVMLLDEPLIHLDVKAKWEIMNLLRNTTRKLGKTVIMATHELGLSIRVADKLWLLSPQGNLIEGCPEDLILKGILDQTFGNEEYHFDPRSGSLSMPTAALPMDISGPDPERLWTVSAINRKELNLDKLPFDFRIEIMKEDDLPLWKIVLPDKSITCISIQNMLHQLTDLKTTPHA